MMDDSEDYEHPTLTDKPRKRKVMGRKRDAEKRRKLSSHETGNDCRCKRLKCFENISHEERQQLILNFNGNYSTKDEQDAYLSTLIKPVDVKRHRPRREDSNELKDFSYSYEIKVVRDDKVEIVPVCKKAIVSIFGITFRRIQTINEALSKTGMPSIDKRGRHGQNPKALDQSIKDRVHEHISSLRARKSHYSLKRSRKLYLRSELNVKKLHDMFQTKFPDVKISYETYRTIFNADFNIWFGYPRSDTCSQCDEYIHKVSDIDAKLKSEQNNNNNNEQLVKERQTVEVQNTLHKKKAAVFYERKRAARAKAETDRTYEAICMDYQKNLPSPNITTNDIYYKRQLSCISFNIHVLSTKDSYFYCYDETIAKKGADDVSSLLYDFSMNRLNKLVCNLEIFCDSCAGQNKNYTIFKFIHWLVHVVRRFDSVKIVFPIRGHSYMESDKDFGLLNQHTHAQVPAEWWEQLRLSRNKPRPFVVIECDQSMFYAMKDYLGTARVYKNSCPFPTRPIKEFLCNKDYNQQIVKYCDSWNGVLTTSVIVQRGKTLPQKPSKMPKSYSGPIPLKNTKFQDLQALKKFCNEAAKMFYDGLVHAGDKGSEANDDSDSEFDEVE